MIEKSTVEAFVQWMAKCPLPRRREKGDCPPSLRLLEGEFCFGLPIKKIKAGLELELVRPWTL